MAPLQRLTTTRKKVLAVLVDAALKQEKLHGLRIVKISQLGTGTAYPILAAFEEAGIVSSFWEDEQDWQRRRDSDDKTQRGPRRRYYELTAQGHAMAVQVLHQEPFPARVRDALA